jgi:hypothetical protein
LTQCYICSKELLNLEIDSRDNKIKPCHQCLAIVQKCVDQLEARDRRKKEREGMGVYYNPVTEEYDTSDVEEIEEFDDDDNEFLDGFHYEKEHEEEEE